MSLSNNRTRVNVLGVGVNATSMDEAVMRLIEARQSGETGYARLAVNR